MLVLIVSKEQQLYAAVMKMKTAPEVVPLLLFAFRNPLALDGELRLRTKTGRFFPHARPELLHPVKVTLGGL